MDLEYILEWCLDVITLIVSVVLAVITVVAWGFAVYEGYVHSGLIVFKSLELWMLTLLGLLGCVHIAYRIEHWNR